MDPSDKMLEIVQDAFALPNSDGKQFVLCALQEMGKQIAQGNTKLVVFDMMKQASLNSGLSLRTILFEMILDENYEKAIKSMLGPDNLFIDKDILRCGIDCSYCMLYERDLNCKQYFEDDLNFHFVAHYDNLALQLQNEPEKLAEIEAKMKTSSQ